MSFARPISSALLASLLLACGGGDDEEPASPDISLADDPSAGTPDTNLPTVDSGETPSRPTATIVDRLGTFEGHVSDLAFWNSPSLTMPGAIMAANGDAGIAIVPTNGQAPILIPGSFSGGLALTETADGPRLGAYDADKHAVIVYAPADPGPAWRALGAWDAGDIAVDSLCAHFPPSEGKPVFHAIPANGDSVRLVVSSSGNGLRFDGTAVAYGPTRKCAASGETLLLLSDDGAIWEWVDGGLVEADDQPRRAPRDFALLETADGPLPVYLTDNTTIEVMGRTVEINNPDTDDDIRYVQIAGGSGNFGAVYRGGALALLTDANELHLVPWLNVTTALGINRPTLDPFRTAPRDDTVTNELDLQLPDITTGEE